MSTVERNDAAAAQGGPASIAVPVREYDAKALFKGDREIVIRHAGSAYRMKITKQGKLILNK